MATLFRSPTLAAALLLPTGCTLIANTPPGTTLAEMQRRHGPPAIIATVGWGQRQTVWSYRYREVKSWNSLMHIYLDSEGKVARFHPGPDPMFDADRLLGGLFKPGAVHVRQCS